ncbi:ABC transporter substrate-binding protein [Thermodesulfobacteriota bacterium]
MKNFTKYSFCFFIFAVMLFSASMGFTATPGVTDDRILLGSTMDQSGPSAFATKMFMAGAAAYLKKVNDAGGVYGRRIEMAYEDGKYNPAAAVAAAKLLIERNKVFSLFMNSGTACALALASVMKQEQIPLVCPMAQSSALGFFKPQKYLFPFLPPYEIMAGVLVDYILSELAPGKKPRIAIFYQDDEYGYGGLRGFQERAKKYNFEPAAELSFKRGNVDFSSYALKLRAAKPDYVILHCLWGAGSAVMKEARKMGWTPQFLGTSGMSDERVIKLAGKEAAAGFISTSLCVDPRGDSSGAVEFREAMKKADPKFATGSVYHLWGYGAANIMVESLKRVGKDLTREKLVSALETFKGFQPGVTPPVTYGSNLRFGGDAVLLQKVVGERNVIFGDWRRMKK